MHRLLGLVLAAVAATMLLALSAGPAVAKPTQEQRVTELVSKLPPGVADTGVCGAQRHGCDIKVTPDGRHVLFAMNNGPLLQWQRGESRIVSAGPLGTGVGDHCFPYTGPCRYEQTPDGRTVVFETPSRLVPEDVRSTDVYIRSPQGLRLISTVGPANGEYSYRFAYLSFVSPDLNRVFYGIDTYGDDPVPWLYEWTPTTGAHRFPSESNPAADVEVVKRLSPDGQHVLFTTTSALVPEDDDDCSGSSRSGQKGCVDIYERTSTGQIKLISTTEDSTSDVSFIGASANADHIFFTTFKSPLNWWDPAATIRLYARIADATTLIAQRVSARSQGSVSEDGSKVFFTTDESLVPEDQDGSLVYDPIVDDFVFKLDPDIYEWSNGRYSLVSTGPLDHNGRLDPRLQGISPDGRYVYFSTNKALVPEDTNATDDVYVRDTVTGTTSLAPRQTSQPPPEMPGQVDAASRDGKRVFFTTDEALVPQDTDRCVTYEGDVRGCPDIYERDLATGATTLISTGPSDPQGSCAPETFSEGPRCPVFIGISPDGLRVFFETQLSLTPNDRDGGLNDVYVSKVVAPGCQPKQRGNLPKKCQ